MSEFIDCDINDGGARDGFFYYVYPVAHNIDSISSSTSGERIVYRRSAPLEFTDGHIVFKLVEDD